MTEDLTLATAELTHLLHVVALSKGNLSRAARTLGIHRRTLQRKLQRAAPGHPLEPAASAALLAASLAEESTSSEDLDDPSGGPSFGVLSTPQRPRRSPMSSSLPVHILFENEALLPPVIEGFEAEGFDVNCVHVHAGRLDPGKAPAEGIWINRMSPSSHTRGHDTSVGFMREMLGWLEAHDRVVINGSRAFEIEMSKARQDVLLRKHGIQTPRTLLAIGREHILDAAATFDGPFITKHNQGGKGLGIVLFDHVDALATYLDSDGYDPGPDHKLILQQYIQPAGSFITRVEIVADRFLFAMRSSTVGGFELCPSDACQIQEDAPDVCPAEGPSAKFSPSPLTADDPLVQRYLALCNAEGLDLAGIEFVTDDQGQRYTYDINGTTNYNSGVLADVGVDGMREVARYVRRTYV